MHFTINGLELTESVEADVTVWFYCAFPGCEATHLDPSEPPDFEIDEIVVEGITGPTWDKTTQQLIKSGWYDIVQAKVFEALANYDELYDHQLDAYESQRY